MRRNGKPTHSRDVLASTASNIGALLQFTGMVSLVDGQDIAVTHDDRLSLIIGGFDLGYSSGPSGPTTTHVTWTHGTGHFAFNLVFGECCTPPAVPGVNLPLIENPVPEPGTLALLGLGRLGLGMTGRRKA